MPTPAIRRLSPASIRRFGSGRDYPAIPDLTAIQTDHYGKFQQADIDPEKRKQLGLEAVLQEIFPIESFDKQINMEYIRYELGKPRY